MVEAFTLSGWDDPTARSRRRQRETGLSDCDGALGVLPRGSQCKRHERFGSVQRCVDYSSPRGWEKLYRRIPGRPGFVPRAQFRRAQSPSAIRAAIRATAGFEDVTNNDACVRRATNASLKGAGAMAKKAKKSGKVCISKITHKRVSCARQRAGRKAAKARKR